MKPFRKRRRGGVVATFESAEAQLLANLAGQVVELLRDRNADGESDPDPLAACATGPLLQGQPAKCPACLSKTNSDGLFTGICGKCRCDTVAF